MSKQQQQQPILCFACKTTTTMRALFLLFFVAVVEAAWVGSRSNSRPQPPPVAFVLSSSRPHQAITSTLQLRALAELVAASETTTTTSSAIVEARLFDKSTRVKAPTSSSSTAALNTTTQSLDFLLRIQNQTRERLGRAPIPSTTTTTVQPRRNAQLEELEQLSAKINNRSVTRKKAAAKKEKPSTFQEEDDEEGELTELNSKNYKRWLHLLLSSSKSAEKKGAAALAANDSDDDQEADSDNNNVSDNDSSNLSGALHALASQGSWTAYFDAEGTGLIYYFNQDSGESRWTAPTSDFPSVKLSPKLNRIAAQRKREYQQQQQEEQRKNNKSPATNDDAPACASQDDDEHDPKKQVGDVLLQVMEDVSSSQDAAAASSVQDLLTPHGESGATTREKPKEPASSQRDDKAKDKTKKKSSFFLSRSFAARRNSNNNNPDVLATQGDWSAFWDNGGTNYVYYYNHQTGKSQWEPPTPTFPAIDLSKHPQIKSVLTTTAADDSSTDAAARALVRQGEWSAYFDAGDTCLVYYYNTATGESQWTKPTADFPTVPLTKQMRQRVKQARKRQQERLRKQQKQQQREWKRQAAAAAVAAQDEPPEEEEELSPILPVPLATHEHWEAYEDEDRAGLLYYFNTLTGTSQWEKPDSFPDTVVRALTEKEQRQPLLPSILQWLVDAISAVFDEHTVGAKRTTTMKGRSSSKEEELHNQQLVPYSSSSITTINPFGIVGDFVSSLMESLFFFHKKKTHNKTPLLTTPEMSPSHVLQFRLANWLHLLLLHRGNERRTPGLLLAPPSNKPPEEFVLAHTVAEEGTKKAPSSTEEPTMFEKLFSSW